MQDNNLALSCNSCHAHVDGIAYKTNCLHLLCPTCAKESFADGHTCAICSTVLSKGEVKEAVIGVSAQVEVADSLFQIAFSTADLGDVVGNLNCMRLAFAQLENFVSTQLLFEASLQRESTMKVVQDNGDLRNQLSSTNEMIRDNEESSGRKQSNLENLLKSREKEMSELKDGYLEKHRKCQAWEKAYNNIRDQVQIAVPRSHDAILNDQKRPTQKYRPNNPAPPHQSATSYHGTRDQFRLEVAPTYHSTQDSQTAMPSYRSVGPTAAISKHQSAHPSHPAPPIDNDPKRTFRRTEVTTYSKHLAHDGQFNEHCSQQRHQPQQTYQGQENHPQLENSRTSTGGPPPQYHPPPSYTSPPPGQQYQYQQQVTTPIPRILNASSFAPQQQGYTTGTYQQAGSRKRYRSEIVPDDATNHTTNSYPPISKKTSSFFDKS